MSIDQVYPTTSSPSWGVIIAEAVDSSGGSAGDGITLNLTTTTPTNKHMFLFGDDVDFDMKSKDKTSHQAGGRSRTTKLGKYMKSIKLNNFLIPTKDITELNDMTDQLEEWMLNGSAQTGELQVFIVMRQKVSGSWRYKTWKNSGVRQNWLKGEVKVIKGKIKHDKLRVTLDFKESD